MINISEEPINHVAKRYGVSEEILRRHYRDVTSGYRAWEQLEHAEEYLIFEQNLGEYLSIDELDLSSGELTTFLTNKSGKGQEGTLVAAIRGTSTKDIVNVFMKFPLEKRLLVKEVTMDMAPNMSSAIRQSFPNANIVIDRFHVVKLVSDALQHIRIKYRWQEIDNENEAIAKAKKENKKYEPHILLNGDTPKQLLARSRYTLMKTVDKWTESQKLRAKILFERYPEIEKAYHHTMQFRNIYKTKEYSIAKDLFLEWISKTTELKNKNFNTAANSVSNHLDGICNFFINRNTNANAESFNAKVKLFRANLRGVIDNKFFLFRLHKLFA